MSSIVSIGHVGNKLDALLFEQVFHPTNPGEIERHYRVFEATFKVFYQGMSHVAGITYSTDGWKTRSDSYASFKSTVAEPGGYVEIWKANLSFQCTQDSTHKWNGIEGVEYVIWCEDYHTLDNVKKIYKTSSNNGGEPFAAVFTGSIHQPIRKSLTTTKPAAEKEKVEKEKAKASQESSSDKTPTVAS